MLAVFKNEDGQLKFISFWQSQENEASWHERTAKALGLKPQNLKVFKSPSLRNDESYSFEQNGDTINLVRYESEIVTIVEKDENDQDVEKQIERVKVSSKEELEQIF